MLLEALPKTKRQMNFVKQREIEKYLLDEHFIKIINTKADENKKRRRWNRNKEPNGDMSLENLEKKELQSSTEWFIYKYFTLLSFHTLTKILVASLYLLDFFTDKKEK